MTPAVEISGFWRVLPFWMSLGLFPLILLVAMQGGWWFLLVPFSTWYLFSMLDLLGGLNLDDAAPETDDAQLFWYRAVTLI